MAKQKKAWREAAKAHGQNQSLTWSFLNNGGKATVQFIFPVTQNRRRDPHNYYPTVKPIVDGLTDAEYWPDDTPEYVETREPIFYKGDKVYVLIHQQEES